MDDVSDGGISVDDNSVDDDSEADEVLDKALAKGKLAINAKKTVIITM